MAPNADNFTICVTPASRAASMALCCVDTLFLVSSIGEDTVALHCLWHYQIEQEMQESGMDWTILRPHHFMQNLLTQTEYIINNGVVYAPSGDGKIPYIDARDVAAVAAVTLAKPGHRGKTYVITGQRGAFLPPGDRDHQQDDWQAAPLRGRIPGRCTGASRAGGLFTSHHRRRSCHRCLSARRWKNGDDHQRRR